jgi:F-type H+-transporting ATPase subunit alpha
MKLRTKEVESVLAMELEAFEKQLEVAETGIVVQVGDGIARVYGLRNVMANELIDFGEWCHGFSPQPRRRQCRLCVVRG